MSDNITGLQVLLVEDDPEDLQLFERDLPEVFKKYGIKVDLHPCDDFGEALARASNPLYRFDLIVSDTYKGEAKNREAEVLKMVGQYRGARFCPLVIYSSSVKPPDLKEGAFLVWADKATSGDIERAISQVLDTEIPQLARKLHDELDRTAGSFLWRFLEDRWTSLNKPSRMSSEVLERIIRRRAAIQLGDMDPTTDMSGLLERSAPEYCMYPAFDHSHYNLGDVLRAKSNPDDWRVVLTPHCYLFKQPDQAKPRADYVLLGRAVPVATVLGDKLENAKGVEQKAKLKKLSSWSRSPAQTDRQPEGRHWYLPAFLDIPHLYCDFLRVESVEYESLASDFERIATLVPPYAEAMQSCFSGFYASVGIPIMRVESIESIFS